MPKYHSVERLSEIANDAIEQEQMFLNRATTQETHASCAESKSIWLDILEVLEENTSLKNQNETLKNLLRIAEEALRKETELRQQNQEMSDDRSFKGVNNDRNYTIEEVIEIVKSHDVVVVRLGIHQDEQKVNMPYEILFPAGNLLGTLEKQVPKKVLNVRNSNKGVMFGKCPNCKKDVLWIDYPYVCGHKGCAQLLDWGKKENHALSGETSSTPQEPIKEENKIDEENKRLKRIIVRNYITAKKLWGEEITRYDLSLLNLSGISPDESTELWNHIQNQW